MKSPLAMVTVPVERMGQIAMGQLDGLGLCGIQFWEAIRQLFRKPFRFNLLVKQMEFIGNKSLGVTLLTGMFTGMVMTFQLYRTLRDFSSETVVGGAWPWPWCVSWGRCCLPSW